MTAFHSFNNFLSRDFISRSEIHVSFMSLDVYLCTQNAICPSKCMNRLTEKAQNNDDQASVNYMVVLLR